MLLPLVFASAAPAAFVAVVEKRAAAAHLHVVDWWSDDLDGDKVPESIAMVCDDSSGFYLVQRGAVLLEAPMQIDGRNACPAAPAARPPFRVVHDGVISELMNVHHGFTLYSLAIRDARLVLVAEDDRSREASSSGHDDEDDHVDYDRLEWTKRVDTNGHVKATEGPLVIVTDQVRRASHLVGATTIAATRAGDRMTLHVHADRALVVRDCSSAPCTSTQVARGDHELTIDAASELLVVAGKTTVRVRIEKLDGDQRYPPPPAAM